MLKSPVPDRLAVHFSSRKDHWATPRGLFEDLDDEFHFDLDPCASQNNAKCARYFTRRQDGLRQKWTGSVFVNPPYSQAKHWIAKAHAASLEGCTVVLLIPSRTDTRAWHAYVEPRRLGILPGEVRFIRGRVTFVGARHGAPFPSAVVVMRPVRARNGESA